MGISFFKKVGLFTLQTLPGVQKIIIREDICIIQIEKDWLKPCMVILKTNVNFSLCSLMDIIGLDFPTNGRRFQLNYYLSSVKFNYRVLIRVNLLDNESIETVSDIFGSAGWLEREIWDMYGVSFVNNLDLRRILTDYGFQGFPLRKDFPMSGFVEIRYDDTEKRIVQELLEVAQEYRLYSFKSPWERL